MSGLANPLNQDHCDCLNRVLQSAVTTEELIEKIEACGIPMGEAREMCRQQRDQATKLKQQFFPNQM